jgi:protein O-GlcNAc transferase
VHDWKDAEVLVMQAGASFAAGRYAEAESALRRALSVIPDEPEWLFNHGLTLELLGRPVDAAVSFARSYRFLDHTRHATHTDIDQSDGFDFSLTDQDDDSDYPADGTVEDSDPSHQGSADRPPTAASIAAHRVGVNLIAVGDVRRAPRWFRRAIRLDRESAEAHTGLIAALGQLGLASEAETAFFEAQQDVEDDARIYVAIAGVLINAGKRERAIWCLREASRLDPSLPDVRRKLATIFAESNRYERARQLYLAELRQDPGDVSTLLDLGRLLKRMNRPDEASEKFRRVLELVPDHPDGHYALADLAESTGDDAAALHGFEILSRLDANFADVRRRLASLLLKRGTQRDLAATRDLLRRERAALRRRTTVDSAASLHQLAILMIRADLCGEAVPLLERVIRVQQEHDPREQSSSSPSEVQPNSDAALLHHHLSVARFELNETDRAMDAARMAVRLDPRMTPAMHNLALAHMRQRQWDRARYWTRQAAVVDPDDPTITRLSTRLRLRVLISVWQILTKLTRVRSGRTAS